MKSELWSLAGNLSPIGSAEEEGNQVEGNDLVSIRLASPGSMLHQSLHADGGKKSQFQDVIDRVAEKNTRTTT